MPEVESVVGKLGRAESALDPAPIGMMESIVILKPEDEWRQIPVQRWFSNWPGWLKAPLAWIAPEHRQITKNEILTALQVKTAIPGVLPPVLHQGQVLVDGAVINNLPTDVMREEGVSDVAAVDIGADDVLHAKIEEFATPPAWRAATAASPAPARACSSPAPWPRRPSRQ